MPTLSPLQTLPSHVVKLIVTHMIDSNRHAYDGIKAYPEECHSRIEPMLWVCRIFREEALSRISIFDPSVRHRGPELAQSAVEADITAFVQKLWQIAPRISTFNSRSLDLVNWPKRYATDFGILAKQLAQRTSRVHDLTHIEFASDSSLMQFIQLAQQSARSLQSLQIVPHKVAPLYYPDISGLIWDGKSRFTAYPSLQKLVLDLPVNLDRRAVVPPQLVFGTFAPFPALRNLTVAEHYPFGDDTLFRGNSKTLEHMHMIALPNVVLILRERQVFMPDSHPRLQRVLIQGTNGSLPEYFGGSSGNFLKFVLRIGPDAAMRVIIGVRFDKEIPRVLDLFSLHPSIQILNLCGTNFTLLTVIRLVKALPPLLDLYSDYPTLDRSIGVFDWAALVASSVRKYAPMGKWFKFWGFSSGGKLTREMVQCVMLLAVLCPNFNYVMSSGDNQMEFMLLARKVIASPGFKDYKQRLRRVLPDVRKPTTFAEDRCPLIRSTMSSLRRKYGA
ncbi:hypothetical protein H4R27_003119 [Coemansia aciculifera]|nr:hypothetical protein H4R27_003119 [Coemansia aciculifera]